jgi:effector-binding domain-containing protein
MSYECEIITRAEQHAIALRTRTPVENLPILMGPTYGKIAHYLGEKSLAPAGAPYTAYYNMDMQDLDVEIGIPVIEPVDGVDDLQATTIPGGKMATCIHKGPYNKIEVAYTALMAFMQSEGLDATGVAYEYYLNDPTETSPEELLTQVFFPLK